MEQQKKGRKLKFKEVTLIIKILKAIDIKECKFKINQALRYMEMENEARNKQSDTQVVLTKDSIQKEIALEAIAHVIDNFEHAEEQIIDFFASYKDISAEEAQEKDIDWVIDTALELYQFGLPKMIQNMLNVDDIKKKMGNLNQAETVTEAQAKK